MRVFPWHGSHPSRARCGAWPPRAGPPLDVAAPPSALCLRDHQMLAGGEQAPSYAALEMPPGQIWMGNLDYDSSQNSFLALGTELWLHPGHQLVSKVLPLG